MIESPSSENTDQETDVWIRRVLGQAIKVAAEEDSDSDDGPLQEPNYEAFRSVEDLTDTAQALYRVASKLFFTVSNFKESKANQVKGHVAGLSLDETVQAVYMLEQRILAWQMGQRRESEYDVLQDDPIQE